MEILGKIAAAFLVIWLLKKAYFEWKFRDLSQEFWAQWDRLSLDEKRDVLYADHGMSIKDLGLRIEEEKHSDKTGAYTDYAIDEMESSVKNCPNYDELESHLLTKAFADLLESYRQAMKFIGDYNFHETRATLNEVFSQRKILASYVRKRR